jgi:hypothetical protein
VTVDLSSRSSSEMGGPPYGVVWSGDDHEYRYVWRDRWDKSRPPLLVACLIPSTADENDVDETVGFCRKVGKRAHPEAGQDAGFGELVVVNMFSRYGVQGHRKAHEVADADDLVGTDNDRWIRDEARKAREQDGTIVVAWGNDGWSRHGCMLGLLVVDDHDELWCFAPRERTDGSGVTKNGFPFHPSPIGALPHTDPAQVVLRPFR